MAKLSSLFLVHVAVAATALVLLNCLAVVQSFTPCKVSNRGFGCAPRQRNPSTNSLQGTYAGDGRLQALFLRAVNSNKAKVQDHDADNKRKQPEKPISHLANDANLSSLIVNNPTWNQNIAALLEYNQTHGTVNIPERSNEYPNLGLWVHNLRQYKGRLAKEQIQQLDDIEFLWKEAKADKEEKRWHEMFMRLKAYKEEHGHCRVPQKYEPDPKLGLWVMNERRVKKIGKMKEDRKKMLEAIGFRWSQDGGTRRSEKWEKKWRDKYQELIEFKEEHNHTHVPVYYPPNQELSHWVNNQRQSKKEGTLREDRQKLLDKIGFTWEFDQIWEESWQEQYEELKAHYQDLANYNKMKGGTEEGNKDAKKPVLGRSLLGWADFQRALHSKGELDPLRKAMLDDIVGFEWWE